MRGAFRALILAGMTACLLACPAARRPEPPPPAPTAPARPVRDYSGARAYQVVPEESLVRIVVYRAGKLANAGHNHVIASRHLDGKVYVHDEITRSGFELVLPVMSLEIDPPELRRAEGADFPPEMPDSAKEGTRRNMLSEALLDGERYPAVTLSALAVEGTRESLQVTTVVGIKDQLREVRAPVTVRYEGERLIADGELELRHTELGLKPYSALLGALQVQDALTVKFTVVASSAGLRRRE